MGALLATVTDPPVPAAGAPEPADRELLAALDPAHPQRARAAFAELYARHAAGVQAFLERLMADRSLAEDALQEVFLALAAHGGEFRGRSLRAWLLAIAANRVRDERRSRRRRARREEAAARDERIFADDRAVLDDELEAALAQLPATRRAALELRFGQDLTHAEVASILGVSLRTAKSWSTQGLAQLRTLLDGNPR